jgi:hypothetical protein
VFDVETGSRVVWTRAVSRDWAEWSGFSVAGGGSALLVPCVGGLARFSLGARGPRVLADLDETKPTLFKAKGLAGSISANDTIAAAEVMYAFVGVWDLEHGKPLTGFHALASRAELVLVAARGERVLVGGEGTLTLHDGRTGDLIATFAGPTRPTSRIVDFGQTLVTLHEHQESRHWCPRVAVKWSRANRAPISADIETTYDRCFNQCPPEDLEIAGAYDEPLRIRDKRNGRVLWKEASSPSAFALSLDGQWCALTRPGLIEIRHARTGEPYVTVRVAAAPVITALAFSPNGLELACGRGDGSIAIYRTPVARRLTERSR